jgi:hypothetical protein
LEFKTYKVISPGKIGKAMTAGWTPVAAINFEEMIEGVGQFSKTRFLIGKGMKRQAQAMPGAGPTPVVMYPQSDADEPPPDSGQLQQLLDRIALMSQEEVLALHAELQEQRQAAAEGDAEADEDEGVREAMDELLGDDEDDGTDDDDDE